MVGSGTAVGQPDDASHVQAIARIEATQGKERQCVAVAQCECDVSRLAQGQGVDHLGTSEAATAGSVIVNGGIVLCRVVRHCRPACQGQRIQKIARPSDCDAAVKRAAKDRGPAVGHVGGVVSPHDERERCARSTRAGQSTEANPRQSDRPIHRRPNPAGGKVDLSSIVVCCVQERNVQRIAAHNRGGRRALRVDHLQVVASKVYVHFCTVQRLLASDDTDRDLECVPHRGCCR